MKRVHTSEIAGDLQLTAAKQATLLRNVLSDPIYYDGWMLRRPRSLAAAFGFCGPPQRFFESISDSIKRSRSVASGSKKENKMPKAKATTKQFNAFDEIRSNIPWDGVISMFEEVKAARMQLELSRPLVNSLLELQALTERAHRPSFRADLKPKLDKVSKLARATMTDLATHDIDSAKKKLREIDSFLQEARDSIEG